MVVRNNYYDEQQHLKDFKFAIDAIEAARKIEL